MTGSPKMRTNIVGSSFYQGAGNIIARLRPGAKLELKREHDNPYDKNAIAVYFMLKGEPMKLGHLSRGTAELLAPRMDSGLRITAVKANVIGGVINLDWESASEDEPSVPDDDAMARRFKGLIA